MWNIIVDRLTMRNYLRLLSMLTFIRSLSYLPGRILFANDYRAYLRCIRERPDEYTPTKVFISKHPYTPNRFLRFKYFQVIRWHIYDMEPSVFKDIDVLIAKSLYDAVYEVVSDKLYSKLMLARLALYSNEDALQEVNHPTRGKDIKAWMSILGTIVQGEHPHVDALRYLYLAGDISRHRYVIGFQDAKEKDSITPYTSTTDPLTVGIFRLKREEYIRGDSPIEMRYLEIFGDQYDTTFRREYLDSEYEKHGL